MSKIVVYHTSIVINDYTIGDAPKLEKKLSLWDPVRYRYKPIAYVYNEDSKQLTIPRGVDINYLESLFDTQAEFSYTPDPFERMSVRLKTMPRDNAQRKSISFLIGEGDFQYTKKYSQLLLNLDTGIGKTYVTTVALTFYQTRAMVITNIDKIKKQWYKTFIEMTDLDETQICDISGGSIITKLMKLREPKFKVYLVNHATISAYAKKHGWESISELFKHLKIGVKVFDEAHLCFENLLHVDMYTNTKRTIYLTATFNRSSHEEDALFAKCTKSIVRYGAEVSKETRKHIVYLTLLYNSHPDIAAQGSMVTAMGFSKTRYADYLMTCDRFFDALLYAVKFFSKKEGKMLILSSKIESAHIIAEFIRENFPDKTVSEYHSKTAQEDKERAFGADIISSTPQSAGTGADIPGLRCLLNTESYSSKVMAKQIPGRLREYDPDLYTYYVEFVDVGFRKVISMHAGRQSTVKKKCVKALTLNLEEVNQS